MGATTTPSLSSKSTNGDEHSGELCQGEGICIISSNNETLHFNSSLYEQKELHEALHTCDLEERKDGIYPVHVNFDHAIMGIGGDVSWLPCVYDEFLVKAKEYEYSFWIVPLTQGQNLVKEV